MDDERKDEITGTLLVGLIVMLAVLMFVVLPAQMLYVQNGWVGAIVGALTIPILIAVAYPLGKVTLWIYERVNQ